MNFLQKLLELTNEYTCGITSCGHHVLILTSLFDNIVCYKCNKQSQSTPIWIDNFKIIEIFDDYCMLDLKRIQKHVLRNNNIQVLLLLLRFNYGSDHYLKKVCYATSRLWKHKRINYTVTNYGREFVLKSINNKCIFIL